MKRCRKRDAGIRVADRAAVLAARARVRVTDPVDPDAVRRDRAGRRTNAPRCRVQVSPGIVFQVRTRNTVATLAMEPFATGTALFDREPFVKLAVAHEPQRFVHTDGGIVIGADVESYRLDAAQLAVAPRQ